MGIERNLVKMQELYGSGPGHMVIDKCAEAEIDSCSLPPLLVNF
jgi:hypothetical protein